MKKQITAALQLSFPVMIGYLFLGIAFGILLEKQGYSFLWAIFISTVVYAGSMQFVLLTFFHSGFHLWEVAAVTLTVNARQLFYGLSFLRAFENMGWKKWYTIFALSDETYSLLCNVRHKETKEGKQLMFLIAFFDQLYWIIGSFLGGLLTSVIGFDTTGIDFAMTALFTVIFIEQWLAAKQRIQVFAAAVSVILCIFAFGFDNFLLPSLILLVIFLLLHQKIIQRKEEAPHDI